MNKREFLDLLRYYLRAYPNNMVNDIVADYEEHFRIGLENGKNEMEIATELGSPKDIAEEFFNHEMPPKGGPRQYQANQGYTPNYQQPPIKKRNSIWIILLIIGIVIFGLPGAGALLGIAVAIISILFALFVTVITLGISGIAVLFSWIPGVSKFVSFGFTGYMLHPLTSILLGIFLICLSIVLCYLVIMLIAVCIKALKKLYLSIRWSLLKRRGQG